MGNFYHKTKQKVANFWFYVKSSRRDQTLVSFLLRSFIKTRIYSEKFSADDPVKLIESYALVFCLTRRHGTHPLRNSERQSYLKIAKRIGIYFSSTWGLHGRAVCSAINYSVAEAETRARLSQILQYSNPHFLPFIEYLKNRYVGHRRFDLHKTGYVETATFSTIFSDQRPSERMGLFGLMSSKVALL